MNLESVLPMRLVLRCVASVILLSSILFAQKTASPAPNTANPPPHVCTLTIYVDGVNQQGGNIGVLLFQNDKGWPEDRFAAYKDIVEKAHPGTVVVKIPDLPPGDYAVALVHDVNMNHKVDKNWLGKPTEQWGMSNNPHALIKAPPFSKAKFTLNHDSEIHIQLQ
jgi:uncharacterized protein (DUF2141 family)